MIIRSFSEAIKIFFKDKVILAMGMIPIAIGTGLYILLGSWAYGLVSGKGREYVEGLIGSDSGASVLYWILFIFVSVVLFFIVNFTFVMIVSVLAAPFNDVISSRVEKKHLGLNDKDEPAPGFKEALNNLFSMIFNELKKVLLILFLTVFAIGLNLIPLLAPVSFVITALLLAIQFVDYSWSRHNLPYRRCFKDIMRNLFHYSVGGAVFFFLMSIPGVNLFCIPLAVIYFTLIWSHRNQKLIGRQ